jgi:pimeloyl-ACP methyl ester carboxylesterase
MNTQKQIEVSGVPVSYSDQGEGQSRLLLHGGAGPASMNELVQALSPRGRVIVPTHPGFNGTARPESVASAADLARIYTQLLGRLGLTDVVVVGNSFGGWIAAEMALAPRSPVKSLVLMNSVGIAPGPRRPAIVDPTAVPPEQRGALSFHDPKKSFAPSTPEALALFVENQKALRVYSGDPFCYDPGLQARLASVQVPVLVAWGTSDKIVDAEYGRALAASFPNARFEPIVEAGHFPHIEQPAAVLELIRGFVG